MRPSLLPLPLPAQEQQPQQPQQPRGRRRRALLSHRHPAPLLLLVLLLALAVPAPAGAVGWPFGWLSGQGRQEQGPGQQQQQGVSTGGGVVEAAACEAALLKGGEAVAGVGNTAEERVLSGGEGKQSHHMATFQARRKHSAELEVKAAGAGGGGRTQGERLWHDYLLSEASKAPMLNAQSWTRLGADTYRCEMAPIAFFSAQIVPVIDVKLEIDPHKRTAFIHARSGKVLKSDGPPDPAAAADGYACSDCGAWNETSFTMKTMNKVTWTHTDDATLRLTSDLSMEVSFEKPSWVWVPNSMMNRVGSLVLKRVVKKALPEFLERIISGYHDWHAAEQLAANGAASAAASAGGVGGGGTVV